MNYRFIATFLAVAMILSLGVSAFLPVPVFLMFSFACGVPLIGVIVTIDDDWPGGFFNPNGDIPLDYKSYAVAAAFAAFGIVLYLLFPDLKLRG